VSGLRVMKGMAFSLDGVLDSSAREAISRMFDSRGFLLGRN